MSRLIKYCIRLWVLDWTSVQPFILKLMISLKGPFRLSRIYFECVMDVGEAVVRTKIGANNFREVFHYSAKIEDNFQPV